VQGDDEAMIVVIADDFSGAAELAGAAANFGLRAEVQTEFSLETGAEVIALDTGTRSVCAPEAARIVAGITRIVVASKPDWIYKKTDSVLRGNVRAEIEAMLGETGRQRAVLIPANPTKRRVIRNGVYLIDEQPLAETAFGSDPEHPRRSSNVRELLDQGGATAAHDVPDRVAGVRIDTPDAGSQEDLARQARELDAESLPSGGVEFFEAVLSVKVSGMKDARHRTPERMDSAEHFPTTLFVCGSAGAWDGGRAAECAAYGVPVVMMPDALFFGSANTDAIHAWGDAAVQALRRSGVAMLAVGRSSSIRTSVEPGELTERLVEAALHVLESLPVARVCLEGGATASGMVRRRKWKRLAACPARLPGVGVLQPEFGPAASRPSASLKLFIKPGSYPWPGEVWRRC
jgi:uncharacterized protein YgbK (DUF1537 family)